MPSPTGIDLTEQEKARKMLHELHFQAHRLGYKQLCIGVPYYHQNNVQSLSKELYPWIAAQFDHVTSQAVEHAVREAIRHAWECREAEVWKQYFPGAVRPPSNKQFIATLAERLT